MTIDEIYQYAKTLIRKNQSGGLKSTDFNRFWNDAQDSYFDDLVGRFQRNNNGKEGINTGLIQNETILIKLSPFVKTTTLPIAAGFATRPSDYAYRLAMRINGYPVIISTSDKIWSIDDDVIDPPSVAQNKYYAFTYRNQYQFNPSTPTSVDMDYVARPIDILWVGAYDSDGRPVYDPVNSIQSQWDDNSNREITRRSLKPMGISFQDKDFENFGQSAIVSGS